MVNFLNNKVRIVALSIFLLAGLLFKSAVSATEKSNMQQTVNEDEMLKAQHYENVVDSYLRGLNEKDLEGILSLFADDATVEDPAGSNIVNGKEALRKFYSGAVTIDLSLTRTGSVRVAGMEAAFPFQLRMKVNGVAMKTEIIDLFRFNEAGKIISMRAFWGPSNQKVATE